MNLLHLSLINIIDITIVAVLLWQLYRLVRGTAAMTIMVVIAIIYVLGIAVRALNMELLSTIIDKTLGVGAIALIIVFQQEIRRFLLMLGNNYLKRTNIFINKVLKRGNYSMDQENLTEIVNACLNMSRIKCGALIALERLTPLTAYSVTGDTIDANINQRLIENIFFKNSPLHDGAMIVSRSRIVSARCILPTSDNTRLPARYGLRHRAAVGLTEHTDAVVIVVSEESGKISVVTNGVIRPVGLTENLKDALLTIFS